MIDLAILYEHAPPEQNRVEYLIFFYRDGAMAAVDRYERIGTSKIMEIVVS